MYALKVDVSFNSVGMPEGIVWNATNRTTEVSHNYYKYYYNQVQMENKIQYSL